MFKTYKQHFIFLTVLSVRYTRLCTPQAFESTVRRHAMLISSRSKGEGHSSLSDLLEQSTLGGALLRVSVR